MQEGAKIHFLLKSSAQLHFLNISLQTANTNGDAEFCHFLPFKCFYVLHRKNITLKNEMLQFDLFIHAELQT